MSHRLDKAISDFEDESLDLTLGERISGIRVALIGDAHEAMKRLNKKGKRDEDWEEEQETHIANFKWFSQLEKLYNSQLKMNKASGKKEVDMDKDFLRKIKGLKSSIGEIVRDIQPITKN